MEWGLRKSRPFERYSLLYRTNSAWKWRQTKVSSIFFISRKRRISIYSKVIMPHSMDPWSRRILNQMSHISSFTNENSTCNFLSSSTFSRNSQVSLNFKWRKYLISSRNSTASDALKKMTNLWVTETVTVRISVLTTATITVSFERKTWTVSNKRRD
jgi:hypothetical protein